MALSKYLKPKKKVKDTNPFIIKRGKYKNPKLASMYRSGWSEDVYISDNREKEIVGKSFNISKLPVISLILVFFISILLAKTAWLQIVKGDYYYSMAEGNRIRIERIEPKRGIIYDRKLRPLVRNKANFLLYFIPADLAENEEERGMIISRISEVLEELSVEEINIKLANIKKYSLESYQPLFITDNIDYEKAILLYLESSGWPGVVLGNGINREYLVYGTEEENSEKNSFLPMSHILGYTGKINEQELEQFGDEYLPIDYIGKMGIEYFWENELKGKSGKKQIEVDALGKEKKIIGQIKEEDGHNLVLSVDLEQQVKLQEILLKHLKDLKLSKAVAILLNPNNGEVLAMVSLPTYNNNIFARGITSEEFNVLINQPEEPLFNRAISGEYPSGSTIKPVLAAAALEEGIITENTSVLSVGGIKIGQWFFPDWLSGGHGRVSVRKAIAQSVNTFFYYIGGGYEDFSGLGVDRIVHYGELFGLNTQTGIDLAGEADGFLPSKTWKEEVKGERWYIGDTYHLSIGQGDLLVTPLQVALFTSVFANGGDLYRPHFIKQILTCEDYPFKEVSVEPVRSDFIDLYNIDVVRQGMRQTVTAGSARSLSVLPVEAAGKTGTAQWSSKKPTHAWFTGFAPFNNPELVITILIEEGGEGSSTAVPIAKEYLEWYFGEYKKEDSKE